MNLFNFYCLYTMREHSKIMQTPKRTCHGVQQQIVNMCLYFLTVTMKLTVHSVTSTTASTVEPYTMKVCHVMNTELKSKKMINFWTLYEDNNLNNASNAISGLRKVKVVTIWFADVGMIFVISVEIKVRAANAMDMEMKMIE